MCRKEIFGKHRVRSIWSEVNSNSELFTSALFAPSDQVTLVSPSTLSKNIKCVELLVLYVRCADGSIDGRVN